VNLLELFGQGSTDLLRINNKVKYKVMVHLYTVYYESLFNVSSTIFDSIARKLGKV
jgi:hypothetical protein